jgi:hypothetical protein
MHRFYASKVKSLDRPFRSGLKKIGPVPTLVLVPENAGTRSNSTQNERKKNSRYSSMSRNAQKRII